jgi:ribose transport system substrate-binding protein
MGVTFIVAHLRGETVPRKVDTGVYLATPENMEDQEIHSLLEPDFSQYLEK